MSFQEDYELVQQMTLENGRAMPDVTTLTPRQIFEMTAMITQTAAELRANTTALTDADMKLAHAAAQMAEDSVRDKPVTEIREEVFASPLLDGTPAMATLLLIPQDDGTVDWTFSAAVQQAPQLQRINLYRGTIGVDGVSYARMYRDGDMPPIEAQG